MFPTVKLADQYADVQEGDLIQLEKGEEVRRGRVHPSNVAKRVLIMQGRTLDGYKQDNYTLHVIEKAKPKLPVEPGINAVIVFDGFVPMVHTNDGWIFVSWLNVKAWDNKPMTWEGVFTNRAVENYRVLFEDRP